MWVRVPPILPFTGYAMNSEERYLEEFKKYKDVPLHLDSVYCKKSKLTEKVMILRITCAGMAQVKNLRTENIQYKTLHWCRKNLVLEE